MDGYFNELSLHARVAQQDLQIQNLQAAIRGYQQQASQQRLELDRIQTDNARLLRENAVLRSQQAHHQALIDSEQWSTGTAQKQHHQSCPCQYPVSSLTTTAENKAKILCDV
jgi:hypothetical protein